MAKVFLSSTSRDLSDYRQKVAAAINDLSDFECVQMESWGAVNATPADYDAAKVADCDLFVLLLGAIYGECKPGTEKSFTELEFDKAVELDKPRIAFSASDDCQFPRSVTKSRPAGDSERLEAFCQRVRQERIWAEFTDPHQLANQVTKAILKWQEELQQLALDKFLNHTIETNSEISLRGVMQTERQVAVKLDEVYVSLKTERKAYELDARGASIAGDFRRGKSTFTNVLLPDLEEESDLTPIPGSRVRWAERAETRTEKVELAEAVREHRRVVILGDPGAGKTTLMRFLALHFARAWQTGQPTVTDKDSNNHGDTRLPILMRVAEYAEALRQNRNAKLRDCLLVPFRNLERNSDGELTRLLEEKLKRGEALLLLDGLDEVTEPSDRVLIANQIEEFVRNTHRDNRVIVTSRIVGYRQAPLGSDYQHFTLLDMEREQIEKFLNGWCLAVERFHSPETSNEELARRAQAEIDDILKSVDANTGVKRLATNPLLLTILAMIHRNGSRLPSRRVDLYELATKTLLLDWQTAKGINESKLIKDDDAAQFLWPLAYWMHSEKPKGLAYEQEVREKLAEFRAATYKMPTDHPEVIAAVNDFLERARRFTGIFVERAPKQFGFMHLTFQEYFAARELTRSSRNAARRIYEVRHKARWEEPIRLAIASRQSPEDGSELIRAAVLAEGEIATQEKFKPSQYEDILHRDLFLAARCLADDVPVYPELRRQIVNRLCELYFDSKLPWALKEDILQIFALLGGSDSTDDLTENLLGQINSPEADMRSVAARAIGNLGENVANEKTLESLIQLFNDSEWRVRYTAAGAIGNLGEKAAGEKTLESLIRLFNDSDANVRSAAAGAIGNLGEKAASEKTLESLIQLFNDSEWYVRSAAAGAIGNLGEKAASEKTLESLIQLFNSSEANVRSAAARAIGKLGEKAASEKTLESLIRLLNDSDGSVRSAAARAIGNLGEKAASKQTLESLIQLFNDSEEDARYAAAEAIGNLGEKAASEKTLESLIQLFNDSESYVRYAAAGAIGKLASQVNDANKPKAIKLALPLARAKRKGEKNDSKRAAGYVMLRNLLAAEK